VKKDNNSLEIFGDINLAIPKRMRTGQTGYRKVTYITEIPEDNFQRMLSISNKGVVTAYASKVDYGQGIKTGFVIAIAEELGIDHEKINIILGDTDLCPWDPGTFGSDSTASVGLLLRNAAATAKEKLFELAAERAGITVDNFISINGYIKQKDDQFVSYSFGELIGQQNIKVNIPENISLSFKTNNMYIGKKLKRIDGLEKVTGKSKYSRDIIVPDMLFAKVIRPPAYGATINKIDSTNLKQASSNYQLIHEGDLLAILAGSDEEAQHIASMIDVSWNLFEGQPSRWDVPQILLDSKFDTSVLQQEGDIDSGLSEADVILEETYYVPYISTTPMEPRAAVAKWDNEKLTVWAGTQRPHGVKTELMKLFNLQTKQVRVITPEIGGGFGAKSLYPVASEASILSKIAKKPVRVAYSRNEETVFSSFRPAALMQMKAGVTADGSITAWSFKAIHAGERFLIGRRGATTPYSSKNIFVEVSCADSPLKTGSYRSLGAAVNHFGREAFIDELSRSIKFDPLQFRLQNLKDERYINVLKSVAKEIHWRSSTSSTKTGQGLAIGIDVGSYVALAVNIEIIGTEIKIKKVAAAIDCGFAIDHDGIINQVEGGIIQGLGGALYEAIEFENGTIINPGFTRYRVPKINNIPEIHVEILDNQSTPSSGAGELGIVPIAAAISNALFDLTCQRIRELPIQRQLQKH
jgi:nicotinate dehydrogenase subunit B